MNPILKKLTCGFIFWGVLFSLSNCKSDKSKKSRNKTPKPSIFDKLSTNSEVEFELTADWDSLDYYKNEEKYLPAEITLPDSTGTGFITEKIEVAARGKTRKSYCDSPPIRLKFPKPLLKASKLAKYKTLKLVTPCKNDSQHEDLLKKEMLCYQIYQTLTDNSFRVQPANVLLVSDKTPAGEVKKEAFLIENDKEMAKRLGGKHLNKSVAKVKAIDVDAYNLLTVFQYMIGNTDWNISGRHNIKLVVTRPMSAPIPVPYDFDYSGFVNAPYAVSHPDLPIKNIRERMFQWRGKDPEMLKPVIEIFKEKKERIFDLLNNCSLKSQSDKTEMIRYVSGFYEILEKENAAAFLTKK